MQSGQQQPDSRMHSQQSSSPQHGDLPPVQPQASTARNPQLSANGLSPVSGSPLYRRGWFIVLVGLILALLIGAGAAVSWYTQALKPLDLTGEAGAVSITIEPGSTPDQISTQLEREGVIRSSLAFSIYTRLEGVRGSLQAGPYELLPSKSTPEIVDQITSNQTTEQTITFYPGSALYINAHDSDQTPSHREVLEGMGYSRADIEAAFSAHYDHPLLADRPAGESIEGYIFGETYQVAAGATIESILTRTFDEMYSQMQQNNLIEAYEARGMTLYEAITLASIIEREVHADEDQRQVAQVFYRRLDTGMPLGADATFVYAARMDGQTPTVDYDSPYNTRAHKGLPPGPIASPSITALKAVADPASGDYLYFVSGDDGINHFSHTLEEHEEKTQLYCRANCALF